MIKRIKSIKSNNLIIYNHNSKKLAKISSNFKKKFSFQFKKIAFNTIYHIVTKGGGIQLTLFLCFITIFQLNMILYYLYKADHKIPLMTYEHEFALVLRLLLNLLHRSLCALRGCCADAPGFTV